MGVGYGSSWCTADTFGRPLARLTAALMGFMDAVTLLA